ncbi:MAG: LysR family transcriptional regulator [Candidatus Eremiobacteraeota bacterium]|nr:LysR family transcriptional regulator [Candidatus Eremiobacteraeota bacterium]
MDLALLHSFVVLAEHRHFGQAAELLSITQPALTKQLQRLEERLGGLLIERDTRHFALTPAGRVLLESARALLHQAEQASRRVGLALEGKAGLLRIGFGIANLSAGLGALLREFRLAFPQVEVELQDMSTPAQLEALANEQLDVGFVRLPVTHPGLAAIPYLQERLIIAHPESIPSQSLAGFAQQPFVATRKEISTTFRDHLLTTCQAAGFVPRIVQEASEVLTILHLVGAGFGVALVPQSCSVMTVPHVAYSDTGVAEASWSIGLVYRQGEADPLVDNFVSLALEVGPGH